MSESHDRHGGRAPDDWRSRVRAVCDRLDRDYYPRVSRYAGGFGTWASSTMIGYEIPLGGRVGRLVGNSARYAKRVGPFGLLGPREQVRDLADIEAEFRTQIEAWLRDREREGEREQRP